MTKAMTMPTTAKEVYDRARQLLDSLPKRKVSATTRWAYAKTVSRMWTEPDLDPLREGDSLDTFYHRRAALHFMARLELESCLEKFGAYAHQGAKKAAESEILVLARLLERLEPALERDPPLANEKSSFDGNASRWRAPGRAYPARGKGSKRHVLKGMPASWRERMFRVAAETGFLYLDVLAVLCLTPARPAEFVPGERPSGRCYGVGVTLSGNRLDITIVPVKSHDGRYGTEQTRITYDIRTAGPAAQHLAALARSGGGSITIAISGTNALRKAVKRLGERTFPDLDIVITPYVFRHQCLADLKQATGSGETVAVAAGHCTDRTQSRYGRFQHGRNRPGFLSAEAARKPSLGHVDRGRQIGAMRRAQLARANAELQNTLGDWMRPEDISAAGLSDQSAFEAKANSGREESKGPVPGPGP